MLDRPQDVRTFLAIVGALTAAWLLWTVLMGAPVWFVCVLAVAWIAGFASGRTDRLTVVALCLPFCWAWGVAWQTWLASESLECINGEGQRWWPPYADCQNSSTRPGEVEVGPLAFFGPFTTGLIAALLLAGHGGLVWRIPAGVVVMGVGVLAVWFS